MAGNRRWEEDIVSSLPPKLASSLMPFQRDGLHFAIKKNGRCLIADEMGLGKTIQAISVAYYYRREWPLLIVVPSSLRLSWVEEIEKWIPDVNPQDIHLIQSGSDVSNISEAKICITTFGLLCKSTSKVLHESLTNQNFQVVIVDESHYIRNNKTASCKAVVPLVKNAARRILLSGTPSLSKPVELYPQIDAVCPGKFGSWWQFTGRYCDARTENYGKIRRRIVDGASNLEELQMRLSNMLMIRRLKNDVLTQLPPKQRQRVLFHLKDSELKTEIKKAFEELKPMLNKNKAGRDILSAMEPSDDRPTMANGLIQKLYRLSGEAKIGPAREYIEMLCENTNLKFLVFAYHHAMMNGLQQSLYDKNVKFIRIDGQTPPGDRLMYVQQFQSDPDTKVAILSILAAGVGLTFTAANLVVFAEMYWTPGVMIQCEDRAHRIGQTACVSIHYLVAKDTMDEWVWSAVCKKTIVTTTTLNGKKQILQAHKGERYQIDVLSNAEAFVPKANEEIDSSIFASQKPRDQMSILDFMTSGKKRKISDQQNIAKRLKPSWNSNTDVVDLDKDVIEILDTENRYMDVSVVSDIHDCIGDITLSRPKKEGKKHSQINRFYNVSKHNQNKCNEDLGNAQFSLCEKSKKISLLDGAEEEDFSDTCSMSLSIKKHCHVAGKQTTASTSKKLRLSRKSCHKKSKKKLSLSQSDESQRNKSNDRDGELVETNRWVCSACTFLNHADLPFCEICSTPKTLVPVLESGLDRITNRLGKHSSSINIMENCSDVKGCSGLHKSQNSQSHCSDESSQCRSLDQSSHCQSLDQSSQCQGFDQSSQCQSLDQSSQCQGFNQSSQCQGFGQSSQCQSLDQSSQCQGFDQSSQCQSLDQSSQCQGFDQSSQCQSLDQSSQCQGFDQSSQCQGFDQSSQCQSFDKNSQCQGSDQSSQSYSSNKKLTSSLKLNSSQDSDVTSSRCDIDNSLVLDTSVNDDNGSRSKLLKDDKDCGDDSTEDDDWKSSVLEVGMQTPVPDEMHVGVSSANQTKSKSLITKEDDMDSSIAQYDVSSNGGVAAGGQEDTVVDEDIDATLEGVFDDIWEEEVLLETADTCHSNSICETKKPVQERHVDLDQIRIHSIFLYCCSRYTGRIYLFDQQGDSLESNFLPLDVEVDNLDQLPDIILHPDNLKLVKRFVREWNSLTETKRRLIMRSGQLFTSPLRIYEDLSNKTHCIQRHRTKEDTATKAFSKAQEINGTTRVIARPTVKGEGQKLDSTKKMESTTEPGSSSGRALVQAVGEDGIPLCLNCFTPYSNKLLSKDTILDEDNAWATRFCSPGCANKYWMKTNSHYARDKVYEAEHGRCQKCGFEAHNFYKQIRDTSDLIKRAELINKSKFCTLKAKQKEQMVRHPAAGQFWHADHIRPVWEGGGECDIDNLRTLCVLCHQKITAEQARTRAHVRRLSKAVDTGDITAFFKPVA